MFSAIAAQIDGRLILVRQRHPIQKHEQARHQRPAQVSDWERYFYQVLYRAGLRPIPQYEVEQYTLDFALFQGDAKLNVEIDGERYHRSWDGELCRRDHANGLMP